jgi:hypothetical protein
MNAIHFLPAAGLILAGTLHAAGISAGGYHTVKINDAGQIAGIGDNGFGQLGDQLGPGVVTITGLTDVVAVAAGGYSTLALKSDGTVWRLGEWTIPHATAHGTPDPAATPRQVPGLAGIDAIAAGHRHFLALDSDTGQLFAWGHNGSGQVGNGSRLDVATPVPVLGGVAAMSAGDGFSLAVGSDGSLFSWGRNLRGQLGTGDTSDRLTPTAVPAVSNTVAVAAGGAHSLILLDNGLVLACGDNSFGQLGLGTTTGTSVPTAVPGLANIAAISAGRHHSAALGATDTYLWGRNFEGQCGGGETSLVTYPSPQTLAGLPGHPQSVDAGDHFTVLGFADGGIWAMGSNSDGQIDGVAVAGPDGSPKVFSPQPTALEPDLSAPSPDPMTFAVKPFAFDAQTVRMTATTATDPTGPVGYFFESLTAGGTDSGWQTSSSYEDGNLVAGVEYRYRVKARDGAGNETAWSAAAAVTTVADHTPPTPNPSSFSIPPTATGPTAVTMTATEASDNAGVEYYFENTAGGGHDSGWQAGRTYIDSGLQAGGYYAYRVRTRDLSLAANTTAFSSPIAVTTAEERVLLATDFTGRTVSGKTASAIPWTTDGLQTPGSLTFVPGAGAPTGTSLFDTAAAQGCFAPDINIGNEGPWSVAIPIVLSGPDLSVKELVIGWQHFDNFGALQISSRSANWTATLSGSESGTLATAQAAGVAGLSGSFTLAFPGEPILNSSETYQLVIGVSGADTPGNNTSINSLSLVGSVVGAAGPAPTLLARYRFDEDNGGLTPDEIGPGFATLGGRVRINTASGLAKVGGGALEMLGGDTTLDNPADGAVTSNSFSWGNSARTITFWWRAKSPNVNAAQGTYFSSGSAAADGTRFDIKESNHGGASQLRVEIQGHGANSNPPSFDDGNWHFVAVVVPENATFADISWFADGAPADLNPSANTLAVQTGTGPLIFGDSLVGDDRVPHGYLDDLHVYRGALSAGQISELFENPGSVVSVLPADFNEWAAAFGLAPGDDGFGDDVDGDGLANGVEAWLGTHPGQPSAGLEGFSHDGLIYGFRHLRNADAPADLSAIYQWSENLTDWHDSGEGPGGGKVVVFETANEGPHTVVEATASMPITRIFLRLIVVRTVM